ncbi:MAG TPA: histidine phosphatase family protein [Kofleriaceae bacterium]|jgi:broad specificity phosphatase PhoE
MAKLLLVRHGQASYGQLDYDRLSPRGEAQARTLGPLLAAQRPSALFVGPLVRQQQTAHFAREAAPELPEPVTIDGLAEYPGFDLVKAFMPKLVEEDPELGLLASAPTRELADRAFKTILARWSRDEWRLEGVERVHEFHARVAGAMTRAIASAASGGTIAVVTSAGPIGVAVGMVFGATAHHMIRASSTIRNASVSELKLRTQEFAWHPDKISLVTFNSTAHLPPDLVTEY